MNLKNILLSAATFAALWLPSKLSAQTAQSKQELTSNLDHTTNYPGSLDSNRIEVDSTLWYWPTTEVITPCNTEWRIFKFSKCSKEQLLKLEQMLLDGTKDRNMWDIIEEEKTGFSIIKTNDKETDDIDPNAKEIQKVSIRHYFARTWKIVVNNDISHSWYINFDDMSMDIKNNPALINYMTHCLQWLLIKCDSEEKAVETNMICPTLEDRTAPALIWEVVDEMSAFPEFKLEPQIQPEPLPEIQFKLQEEPKKTERKEDEKPIKIDSPML